MEIFIDPGRVNFCWVKYDCVNHIVDSFDLIPILSINDITTILDTFDIPINVEIQIANKNYICARYEHHIESYCNIKKIPCSRIDSKEKFKILGVERPSTHYKRKRLAIALGKKLIEEKKITCYDEILLKKQDDLFDCVLMGYTKYKTITKVKKIKKVKPSL